MLSHLMRLCRIKTDIIRVYLSPNSRELKLRNLKYENVTVQKDILQFNTIRLHMNKYINTVSDGVVRVVQWLTS